MDAGQLVHDHGVTAESERTDDDPTWEVPHNAYKVTLRRPGARPMVVTFKMGIAHTKPPTAEDVLECLASDSSSVENAGSFEDWCAEFGFDLEDRAEVRKYHGIYTLSVKQAERLRRFLGGELYEALVNKSDEGDEEYAAYRIVNDGRGSGGFLCPPGHPNHTYVLEHLASSRGRTAQGFSTISYALTPEANASPEIRAQVQRILDAAQLVQPERWVRMVYGYFRHCYAPESGDRDVSKMISDHDNNLPPERHLAVLMVREYFPDHEPRQDLITDPGNGYGQTVCSKCGARVQYEPGVDALVAVSLKPGRDQKACPEGGEHVG